ncbi:MAG: esterase [Proteobacteria bacterium]|nr:esterase [Pseudomonadota bacterium]
MQSRRQSDARFSEGIAPEADPSQTFDWFFPRGPLRLQLGYGYEGRAWFPIDVEAIQAASLRGDPIPYADHLPAGMIEASESLQKFSQALGEHYETLILGGFSQGAMLSCDAGLQLIKAPRALILLSGNLVAKTRWKERMPIAKSMQIFQSHGHSDFVLPYAGADGLAALWQKYGYDLRFISFHGGHEIPDMVLKELRSFLKSLD